MTTKATARSEESKAAPAKEAPKPAVKPAARAAVKPATKQATAKPAPEAEKTVKPEKAPKSKVIRDSFTFPETDYLKISELKKTCLGLGINAKKSEILRAGLHVLAELDRNRLREVISRIEKIKTGRPLGSEAKPS